jgi:hypothetical protein
VFASRSLHFADDVVAGCKLLCPVMAAQTCRASGLGMVKLVRGPSRKAGVGVAAFARIRRRQMSRSRCIGLAQCIGTAAIVTGHAIAKDANVIKGDAGGPSHKVVGIMAIRTVV